MPRYTQHNATAVIMVTALIPVNQSTGADLSHPIKKHSHGPEVPGHILITVGSAPLNLWTRTSIRLSQLYSLVLINLYLLNFYSFYPLHPVVPPLPLNHQSKWIAMLLWQRLTIDLIS